LGNGSSVSTKDPKKVEAGKASARVRWGEGPPRIVRLDDLTQAQRRLVLALVTAAKAENDGNQAA
jgi:hypothetical protein